MPLIKADFFRTIKFKLALVFTIVLFIFTGATILVFNVAINNYLSTRATQPPPVATNQNNPPSPLQETDQQRTNRAVYSNVLETIQRKSIFALFPLMAVCFLLGYFLANRFLKPLRVLNAQIEKLKSDNLGTQINRVPKDEVGKIISSFNDMSLRLQRAFQQQARFVQDASHELRTPLTIVRTNIDTALDNEDATKQELADSMKEALLELDSVTNLANDLLTLSRPQSKIRETVNLVDIIRECVSSMKDIAIKNNVILESVINVDLLPVRINRIEITRAINNLIDNAVKYAKDNKQPNVLIKSDMSYPHAVIQVQDNGLAGIPKNEIGKIFDRFYRIDKSRVRDTGGFGLGLPITKKIILEHGGKVSVKSIPGSTVFTIQIPLI